MPGQHSPVRLGPPNRSNATHKARPCLFGKRGSYQVLARGAMA